MLSQYTVDLDIQMTVNSSKINGVFWQAGISPWGALHVDTEGRGVGSPSVGVSGHQAYGVGIETGRANIMRVTWVPCG